MTSFSLFVTRKDGPLSPIFPFHATSIARSAPFASHGFSNEPTPVEPSGQSWCGSGAALATGVGMGAGVGKAGALFTGAGLDSASSLLQPTRHTKTTSNAFDIW